MLKYFHEKDRKGNSCHLVDTPITKVTEFYNKRLSWVMISTIVTVVMSNSQTNSDCQPWGNIYFKYVSHLW